jgi:hypothetical protein
MLEVCHYHSLRMGFVMINEMDGFILVFVLVAELVNVICFQILEFFLNVTGGSGQSCNARTLSSTVYFVLMKRPSCGLNPQGSGCQPLAYNTGDQGPDPDCLKRETKYPREFYLCYYVSPYSYASYSPMVI